MGNLCRRFLLLVLVFLFISSCVVEDEEEGEIFVNPCGNDKCVVYIDVTQTNYNCFYENDYYCLYRETSSTPTLTTVRYCSNICKGGKWKLNEICQEYISYCYEKTGKCKDYSF